MADLREWRQARSYSLDKMGELLGFGGRNRARTIQRLELGESLIDADLAEAILKMTDGAVTPLDLHRVRLAWLKANGRARAFGPEPELFDRRGATGGDEFMAESPNAPAAEASA